MDCDLWLLSDAHTIIPPLSPGLYQNHTHMPSLITSSILLRVSPCPCPCPFPPTRRH